MQDTYWKQFMMSGKIEDYLSYKNSRSDNRTDEMQSGPREKEKQPQGGETEQLKLCEKEMWQKGIT